MIKKLKDNFINIALVVLMLLLVLNGILMYINRTVLIENTALKRQTELMKFSWKEIFENNLQRMDLSLRGYALVKNEQLLNPYRDGVKDMARTLHNIDSLLTLQGLDSIKEEFASFKVELKEFMRHTDNMRELAAKDSMQAFIRLLNEDKGRDLWNVFAPIFFYVRDYENKLVAVADVEYQKALDRNVIFQIVMILLGLPTTIVVLAILRRAKHRRDDLLKEFERNSRKYVFDPGTDYEKEDGQMIIQRSIQNLKNASVFIKSIAGGDYAVHWETLTSENASLNQNNLVGDLIKMRDTMKTVKEVDVKRIWSTEGLTKFSDVARIHQNDIKKFSNEVIRFLANHLKAQQGSLYVLKDEDEEKPYLQLLASFAYDKRRLQEKRVEIGEGLIGRAYIEGSTVLLTEVPKDYPKITSIVVNALPACIIIVPMKYNDRVEAVLELATFERLALHEIEFLEKCGEITASSIFSTKINERTSRLLEETREQAAMLRPQEEELRQNMEEMQATQENMKRKEIEILKDKNRKNDYDF